MTMSIFTDRVKSSFDVSIGTSLALESVSDKGGTPYDPTRVIPEKISLDKYSSIWFNISTLMRNLIGALPADTDIPKINSLEASRVLEQELENISDICKAENPYINVVHYVCDYSSVVGPNSAAQIRVAATKKQLEYQKLHNSTIQKLLNAYHTRGADIPVFKRYLKPPRAKAETALIVTHQAYDLLSNTKFDTLDLLESHTGVRKTKKDYYTKFYNGKELATIPFIEVMLKFYGDSHLFKPMQFKARQTVLELSKAKKWSWATTSDKVIQDLSLQPDKWLYETIRNL